MNASEKLFLSLLRCSIHREKPGPIDPEIWREALRLARAHSVTPLVVDAAWSSDGGQKLGNGCREQAKRLTCTQAHRTGDFLLLYDFLVQRGLRPAVMKGIVLRAIYPNPEQRASTDEDLLIRPEEFSAYHRALLDYGLSPVEPGEDLSKAHEVSYADRGKGLYIELHMQSFPPTSEAYGELLGLFDGVLDRCVNVRVYGQELVTLSPTDHLLYLLCHAYKHFLHGGFGIRQVCDIGIFTKSNSDRIDWAYIRQSCEGIRIERFAAGIYRITEKHLGFSMPEVFADTAVDESDLLTDILTGGLYGVNDINRAHSATITLDAVARQKQGKKSTGLLASVFLPLDSMRGKYPYLNKHPWLLPVAWAQRVGRYMLSRDKRTDPAASARIGKERIILLREYGIID